jgi:hypothetical protein
MRILLKWAWFKLSGAKVTLSLEDTCAGSRCNLRNQATGRKSRDPPVAVGGPLARPPAGMLAALAGRQAARARFGVPVPGRAVDYLGRGHTRVGSKPRNPRFLSEHGIAPRVR